jgi:hypothetical protein
MRKKRKEREDDFNVEKGERLFPPWISFSSSPPSFFSHDFQRKRKEEAFVPLLLIISS